MKTTTGCGQLIALQQSSGHKIGIACVFLQYSSTSTTPVQQSTWACTCVFDTCNVSGIVRACYKSIAFVGSVHAGRTTKQTVRSRHPTLTQTLTPLIQRALTAADDQRTATVNSSGVGAAVVIIIIIINSSSSSRDVVVMAQLRVVTVMNIGEAAALTTRLASVATERYRSPSSFSYSSWPSGKRVHVLHKYYILFHSQSPGDSTGVIVISS